MTTTTDKATRRRKPIDPAREQRYHADMVRLSRRFLFVEPDPEDWPEMLEWCLAAHIACRDRIEYANIQVLTKELAGEVKPLADEILHRAMEAGRP